MCSSPITPNLFKSVTNNDFQSMKIDFYWKFRKSLCLLKKCIVMKPENYWVNNICLDFFFFFCYTWSCLLEICIFLVFFCYWPNSFIKGDERDIFRKAPVWKPSFLCKIKIKQNPGYPNKEYNVVFKHFHQNIRAYRRSKTNLQWPMIGKVLHIGRNLSKERCWRTSLVCPKYSLGTVVTQG